MTQEERYSFNSNDLLFRVFQYKKQLIIITAVAFIASIIVSFQITPLYKSSVVLFPAPSTSISQSLISTTNSYRSESVFGAEEEVEQILQVLSSDEIRSRIVEKYDLWKHYEVDSLEDKYPKDKLTKIYNERIQSGRTEYMAVEIQVFDAEPEKAALIANDLASLVDSVMNDMEKARSVEAFKIVAEEYDAKNAQLVVLEDSLAGIMAKGVFDFESQSEVYNRAYADAISSGNLRAANKIQEKLDTLAKYGSAYVSLRDFLLYEKEQLSLLNAKYKEAKVDAEQNLTHYFVVNKAYESDKKAKPKRMIIVLVSTLATFIFAFVVLVILDMLKDFRTREKIVATDKE